MILPKGPHTAMSKAGLGRIALKGLSLGISKVIKNHVWEIESQYCGLLNTMMPKPTQQAEE
jgi:hypothetical protein